MPPRDPQPHDWGLNMEPAWQSLSRQADGQVLVLLSDGFGDEPVLALIITLRKAAIPVRLVGFSKKEIRSAQGVVLQPDLPLDDIKNANGSGLLIIPDAQHIHTRVTTDPRVHTLVEALLRQDKPVLATPQVAFALRQLLRTTSQRLVSWQE